MSIKHTVGPWHTSAGIIIAPNLAAIATIPTGAGCVRCAAASADEAHANARLIAAAPELLEALQAVMDDNRRLGAVSRPNGEAARAAIAKAEGR